MKVNMHQYNLETLNVSIQAKQDDKKACVLGCQTWIQILVLIYCHLQQKLNFFEYQFLHL